MHKKRGCTPIFTKGILVHKGNGNQTIQPKKQEIYF